MGVAQKDILNGWKEIAGYVARDIRTVERWEKQRGLPVRRVPGSGRATVYARISELEQWLASKPLEGDPAANPETENSPQSGSGYTLAAGRAVEEPFAHQVPAVVTTQGAPTRARWLYSVAAASLFVFLVAAFYLRHSRAASAAPRAAEVSARPLPLPHSSVPGVEDSYLQGSYLYEQRTPESLSKAVTAFESAIARDPKFAPAYAGLANTYNLLREYSVMPDATAYPLAREAAERAITLDPSLADAHTSLAFVTYYWYMNPAKAEHEFKAAIALDPNSSQAHHWYGSMLTHEGRFDEALRELDIAQHLQPASSAILTSRAFALGVSGHAEKARAMLRDLLSQDGFGKDPKSTTAHLVLGIVCVAEPRDWQEQFNQWREVVALKKKSGDLLAFVNAVEPAFKQGGEPELWKAALAYETAVHPNPVDVSLRMAEVEANLGHTDNAFNYLNRIADRHDTALIGLSLDPLLRPLHADPRYAQLRARLGLPKVSS